MARAKKTQREEIPLNQNWSYWSGAAKVMIHAQHKTDRVEATLYPRETFVDILLRYGGKTFDYRYYPSLNQLAKIDGGFLQDLFGPNSPEGEPIARSYVMDLLLETPIKPILEAALADARDYFDGIAAVRIRKGKLSFKLRDSGHRVRVDFANMKCIPEFEKDWLPLKFEAESWWYRGRCEETNIPTWYRVFFENEGSHSAALKKAYQRYRPAFIIVDPVTRKQTLIDTSRPKPVKKRPNHLSIVKND